MDRDMKISLKLASEPTATDRPRGLFHEKQAFAEDPHSAGKAAAVGGGRHILVVDDNPIVLKAFEFKLRACGFKVTTLANAAEIASTAEEVTPELIILDINFAGNESPEWDGYTSLNWLRRFPNLAGIPVIFVTGEDARRHRDRALKAGAVAFFQKPMPYPELLAAIVQALGIKA